MPKRGRPPLKKTLLERARLKQLEALGELQRAERAWYLETEAGRKTGAAHKEWLAVHDDLMRELLESYETTFDKAQEAFVFTAKLHFAHLALAHSGKATLSMCIPVLGGMCCNRRNYTIAELEEELAAARVKDGETAQRLKSFDARIETAKAAKKHHDLLEPANRPFDDGSEQWRLMGVAKEAYRAAQAEYEAMKQDVEGQ